MNVYIYAAALLCEDCGEAQRKHLDEAFAENGAAPGTDEDDSDRYPQGPYPDGGGEADSPQHCDQCGLFLDNALTGDGESYVLEEVAGADLIQQPGETATEFACRAAESDKGALAFWIEGYDYLFPTPDKED